MRRTIIAVLILVAGLVAADAPKQPVASEADKLAIRSAQVDVLQAQRVVDQAQLKLQAAVNEAYAHAGVTLAEYGMNDKLEFTPVPKPPAPPTGVKAAPSPVQPPK